MSFVTRAFVVFALSATSLSTLAQRVDPSTRACFSQSTPAVETSAAEQTIERCAAAYGVEGFRLVIGNSESVTLRERVLPELVVEVSKYVDVMCVKLAVDEEVHRLDRRLQKAAVMRGLYTAHTQVIQRYW